MYDAFVRFAERLADAAAEMIDAGGAGGATVKPDRSFVQGNRVKGIRSKFRIQEGDHPAYPNPAGVPADRKESETAFTRLPWSFVTELDLAIEARLHEMIAAEHPDHGILGEEFAATRPTAEHVGSWFRSTALPPSSPACRSTAR